MGSLVNWHGVKKDIQRLEQVTYSEKLKLLHHFTLSKKEIRDWVPSQENNVGYIRILLSSEVNVKQNVKHGSWSKKKLNKKWIFNYEGF